MEGSVNKENLLLVENFEKGIIIHVSLLYFMPEREILCELIYKGSLKSERALRLIKIHVS